MTFCDKRWGSGGVYNAMGFKYIGDTKPGYWYIKGESRIHRYKLRKKHDEPRDKTEYDLRLAEGYLRIWDCGHSKFEWKKGD